MKKILSTLALSSLVLLTTGCSDFLEEDAGFHGDTFRF